MSLIKERDLATDVREATAGLRAAGTTAVIHDHRTARRGGSFNNGIVTEKLETADMRLAHAIPSRRRRHEQQCESIHRTSLSPTALATCPQRGRDGPG